MSDRKGLFQGHHYSDITFREAASSGDLETSERPDHPIFPRPVHMLPAVVVLLYRSGARLQYTECISASSSILSSVFRAVRLGCEIFSATLIFKCMSRRQFFDPVTVRHSSLTICSSPITQSSILDNEICSEATI